MKLTAGVEWAVHCSVVLSQTDEPVSAQQLAELHGVSKTYLAKTLQALSRADIITATEGRVGGYRLAHPAEKTTLLDVVLAVDGAEPAFRCTEIRQNGPLPTPPEACVTPCGVARAMQTAEQAWRRSLASVTIAGLAAGVGAEAFAGVRAWLAQGHPPADG